MLVERASIRVAIRSSVSNSIRRDSPQICPALSTLRNRAVVTTGTACSSPLTLKNHPESYQPIKCFTFPSKRKFNKGYRCPPRCMFPRSRNPSLSLSSI